MVEPLSIEEFERLLSRGRGKAILYLQTHDAAPYLEVIRRCCLTNTAYDSRVESPRTRYLIEIIDLIGDSEAVCEAAIQALHRETEYTRNSDHLFELLCLFAQRGLQAARQAMYAWGRAHYNPYEMAPDGLTALVELDGVDAFLFLLDPLQSGRWADMDENSHEFERLLHILEENLGNDQTLEAFKVATHNRPALRDAIERLYAQRNAEREAREQRRREPREWSWMNASYAEFRRLIDIGELSETSGSYAFGRWSKEASDADLYAAAIDFNSLSLSLNRQMQYMRMFWDRVFPLNDFSRLFDLARQTHLGDERRLSDHFAYPALGALENIADPQIRAFALEMIADRNRVGRVVSLLAKNFEEGDWNRIESLFDTGLDEEEIHDLGFSIHDVFKNHPSPDAIPSLIRMYDANPCSHCRERVVESLVSLNALPDWIADECRYDANLDLRAYAERGFKDDDDPDD